MKKLFIGFTLAALGLICAGTLRAQNIYTWTPVANGRNVDGGEHQYDHTLALTVPAKVTAVNITSSRDFHCDDGIVYYDYTVTSGPAVIPGEVIETASGIPTGMFKVLSVGTDPANGSLQMTVAENTCEAYPNSGYAQVGPPLVYNLYFDELVNVYGYPIPGATCDAAKSSVTAYFLDANGNLQSVSSAAGSVSCTNSVSGTHIDTKGQFTGTGTDGQPYTVPLEITNQGGYHALFYAQSATWTVASGGAAAFYPCGSPAHRRNCLDPRQGK